MAENTDSLGFLDALPDPPAGKRALVMGSGGSARAVVWALVEAGASVRLWNRTPERAERLAADFGVTSLPSGATGLGSGEFDLIVNATTVGMGATGERPGDFKSLPVDADSLDERNLMVDLAYGPIETELTRVARAQGATVVDGLEVLVHQGAASLRIWTGLEPPIETMRRAALSG